MLLSIVAAIAIQTAAMSPSPAPSPTPTPAATPLYTLDGAFAGYTSQTTNVNAAGALDTATSADLANRTDISNALLVFAKSSGTLRFGVTVGAYAFPVVGQSLNPTSRQSGANSDLFSPIPLVDVAWVPNAHWTFVAGKLPTLLGQENGFTYQNINIQRGLGWNAEPIISRGVRAVFTQGKFTGDLEFNDGYYSGSRRATEGLFGWQADPNTQVQFAWIVPGSTTPGNITSVIANKREYDLMLTQQFGKLQLLPYALWINSPAVPSYGYSSSESALALVLLANYVLSPSWSLGARAESFRNNSGGSDSSLNSDFLGYGPGSSATSWTITPMYKNNMFFVRAEFSSVHASNAIAGTAFGINGTAANQSRVLLESGLQF